MAPIDGPPTLSQAEAAKACGVSTATIRRARRSGRISTAYEDGRGGWLIPIPALIEAGLLSPTTPPAAPDVQPSASPAVTPDDTTVQLRRELAEARHRAERAEAVAAERERTIEVLQTSLRMLERGQSDTPPPQATQPPPSPPESTKRGGLRGLLGF